MTRGAVNKGRFKALNHEEEDSGCWLSNTNSSSSNTPSDTEDSITSSSSCGSKMSRRQRRNKKRKKNRPNTVASSSEPSRTSDDEPPLSVLKDCWRFGSFARLTKSEEELHRLLLQLCVGVEERIVNGYPYQTYKGTFVYKNSVYNRLEYILGNHKLVDEEIENFSCKNYYQYTDEDNSTPFIVREMSYLEYYQNGQHFAHNYQKCSRCRQFFNVLCNGQTICSYHPKKAILTTEGVLQYICCKALKSDLNTGGCVVSNYHVYHHLTSGINGPLSGFVSTQPSERPPRVFALDCEMVFTSLGFEVARATLVNIHGLTVLDLFIQPIGTIFDFNTEFSGIMPEHLLSAIPFREAQSQIVNIVRSSDILVGHSLEGDLVVLKILHRRVIDTSLLFKATASSQLNSRGGSPLPRRQGLKALVKQHLGQDIQKGDGSVGHSSVEDATAALFLALNQVCREAARKESVKRSKIAPMPPMLRAIIA